MTGDKRGWVRMALVWGRTEPRHPESLAEKEVSDFSPL
jgi:hypothetical protein